MHPRCLRAWSGRESGSKRAVGAIPCLDRAKRGAGVGPGVLAGVAKAGDMYTLLTQLSKPETPLPAALFLVLPGQSDFALLSLLSGTMRNGLFRRRTSLTNGQCGRCSSAWVLKSEPQRCRRVLAGADSLGSPGSLSPPPSLSPVLSRMQERHLQRPSGTGVQCRSHTMLLGAASLTSFAGPRKHESAPKTRTAHCRRHGQGTRQQGRSGAVCYLSPLLPCLDAADATLARSHTHTLSPARPAGRCGAAGRTGPVHSGGCATRGGGTRRYRPQAHRCEPTRTATHREAQSR